MKLSTTGLSIRPAWSRDRGALISALLAAASAALAGPAVAALAEARGLHLHGFDTPLFLRQVFVIKLHMVSALAALAIGTVLMLGPKGKALHKTLGWTWVGAMAIVVVSSFFVRVINPGRFSYLHALSAYTAITIPMGVAIVRRGHVRKHRRIMTRAFVFGLMVAGLFTFFPGRLMWRLFVNERECVCQKWTFRMACRGAGLPPMHHHGLRHRRGWPGGLGEGVDR